MKNLCSGCGKNFRSVNVFDKHRVGKFWPISSRRCLSADEMVAKGFFLNKQGKWSYLDAKSSIPVWERKAS